MEQDAGEAWQTRVGGRCWRRTCRQGHYIWSRAASSEKEAIGIADLGDGGADGVIADFGVRETGRREKRQCGGGGWRWRW